MGAFEPLGASGTVSVREVASGNEVEGAGAGSLFEVYAESWFRLNRISWKPSVRRDFRSILSLHLIPRFKGRHVGSIDKRSLKEFRMALGELKGRKGANLSNKRINNIYIVLRLIISEAADELDFNNPFVGFRALPLTRSEISPFTFEEVFRVLDAVPTEYRDYYVVRFFTGMRTAEIDGLKWKYVDFSGRKILVRETWQNREWVSPKTPSSVRDIDMSQIVLEALMKQKERTGSGELVFTTKRGWPLESNNITKRIWYPALRKASLATRTPYQTRHTAATMWLASGENPEWVARQLGHANTEMLFKVYSRFIPNLTRRDGSAFESFVERKISVQEPTSSKNGKKEEV